MTTCLTGKQLLYRDMIVNGTFNWNFGDDPSNKFNNQRVCRNWINIAIDANDPVLLAKLFERCNIPNNLTVKEQICYYQLFNNTL